MMNESVDQLQQTRLHEQVIKLSALKSALSQKPEEPEVQLQLKTEILGLISDTSFIPQMVITSSGIHIFSQEDRELLLKKIRETDPKDPQFWEKAQGIADNAYLYVDAIDRKEQEDLHRIQEKKQKAGSLVYSKAQTNEGFLLWEKGQDALAEKIISSDPMASFGDSLVEALVSTPQYEDAGTYLKQKRNASKNIQVVLARTPPGTYPSDEDSETLYTLTKELIESGKPLKTGHQMDSSEVVGRDNADRLAVAIEEFKRFPAQRTRIWARLKAALLPSVSFALSPERAIETLIPISNEEKEAPDIVAIRDTFAEIQQLYNYIHVQDQIDKYHQNDSEGKTYLKALVLEKMALQGQISPTLAYEILQGNEVLNQSLKSIIQGLTNALGTPYTPTSEASKNSKAVSKLIVAAALVAIISQTNPQDYISTAQRMVDWAQSAVSQVKKPQISKEALEKLNPEEETVTPTPAPDKKTPTPTPTPVESKASPKDRLPDKNYDGKGITKDNLHWASSASTESSAHSAKTSVSPEGFLEQSSTIAWEILKKADWPVSYLSEQISPIYDPENNTFHPLNTSTDSVNWHTPTGAMENAQIQLIAKRQYVDRYISVPALWTTHIDSAAVTIVSKDGTTESIPVEVGTSPTGQLLIKLPNYYSFSSMDGKEIQIKVGISSKYDREIDTSFLAKDEDAKYPNPTVFPKQLLDLIEKLNSQDNIDSLSDLQKLIELRAWFVNNGTYSFDERYFNYYLRGNPTNDQFLRRFFGTGNTSEDQNYIDDPAYLMKGVCENFNTLFATAARMLDLKDGQIVMTSGYIHSGLFSSSASSNITEGQLHAWAVYITNDNVHIDMDATPTNIDEFTRQVVSKSQASSQNSASDFRAQEAPPREPKMMSNRNYAASDLTDQEPIPQIIEEALTTEQQPLNSWRIILPSKEMLEKAKSLGVQLVTYEYFSGLSEEAMLNFNQQNNTWEASNSPMTYHDTSMTFPNYYGTDIAKNLEANGLGLEDFAPEVVGLIKLTGNTVVLPNSGVVSPRSVIVNRIVKKEDGTITKEPLPIARFEGDFNISNFFQIVIDEDADKLAGQTVEIKYKTYLDPEEVYLRPSEATRTFGAIIPIEWFAKDFQEAIRAIDKASSYEDIMSLNLGKVDTGIKTMFARGWKDNDVKDKPYSKYILDMMKINLVSAYITDNYFLTWNPEWTSFYAGDESQPQEFWERATKFKKIDPTTASTLLTSASRLMKSQQGDFNIPVAMGTSYVDFAQSGPLGFFENFISGYPDQRLLFTKAERSINANLMRLNPEKTKNVGNGKLIFDRGEKVGFTRSMGMKLDPLSADTASSVLEDLLSADELSNARNTGAGMFVTKSRLSSQARFEKSIQEWLSLRYLNWYFNEPWIRDVAFSFAASLLITDHIRRRTHWWRGINPTEYKKILGEVAIEYGITTKDHPVYGYLNNFYEQVLKPYEGKKHILVVSLFQKSRAMDKFLATEKRRTDESGARVFHPSVIKDIATSTNAKEFAKQWLEGTREYNKIRELATQKYSGDAATRKIARKMLHRLYHQPFVEDVMADRLGQLATSIDTAMRSIPNVSFRQASFPARRLRLTQKSTVMALDNPEQFVAYAETEIESQIKKSVALEFRITLTTVTKETSKGKVSIVKWPEDVSERIHTIARISAMSLLRYYELVEEERRYLQTLEPPKKSKRKP